MPTTTAITLSDVLVERLPAAHVGQIGRLADADVAAVLAILAGDLGQPLLDLAAALERGHEPGVERHLREVPVGLLQALDGVVGIGLQHGVVDPARLGHASLVVAPQ